MRRRLCGVLGACAVGLLVAIPATAGASGGRPTRTTPPVTRTTPVLPGSGYLALGDSVTFGYEESNVVPPPNYHDASSFLGYPEQFGAQLRLAVANAGCPGETSASLINPSAPSNGCENLGGKPGGYRTIYPLHVRYKGSQLAYGVSYLKTHRNVRLVSLMIGANDYFLCSKSSPDSCTSAAELRALKAKISANVRTILSAVRKKAHYKGQLAIMNYYSINYASTITNTVTGALNQAQDGAAKPFGVVIADGFGLWRTASVHSAGGPCKAGLLTQLSTGMCGVHPTYAGQALLAQALMKAVRLR